MPVALITGASRGIGRAIAAKFAELGYDLFLHARREAHLQAVSDDTAARGRRVVCCGADLSLTDAAFEVGRSFGSAFDHLDVLVNNAGVALARDFGEYTSEDYELVMNVNARAPFFLTQQVLPFLKAAETGTIVNIGSVVSKKGYEKQALYAASKHAVLGFTKSIARELLDQGIRVHAVLPGGVNTEMLRAVRPDINADEMIAPDEIAQVVADLVLMHGNAVIDEVEIRRRTKTPWG